MLARSFARWLRRHRPDIELQVVSFRPGPLAAELRSLAVVVELLEPHEPWDHRAPDPRRSAALARAASELERPDAALLVSVAAGQCLPYLADDHPVVTWSVELGEDLHWVRDLPELRRTRTWLAGTEAVAAELGALLPAHTPISVVPEFVDDPADEPGDATTSLRAAVEVPEGRLLAVGAGIATVRKAPDLFLEVALAHRRHGGTARFAWIGGEGDPLFPLVGAEAQRVGLGEDLALVASTPDLVSWLGEADVFVHPARLDAFPLVCLHAAAAGTPVVAFSGAGGAQAMFGPSFVGAAYPDVAALSAQVGALADEGRRAAVAAAQRTAIEAHLAPRAAPVLLAALEAAA